VPAGVERGLQQDAQIGATQGTHGFSVDPDAARRGAVVQPAGAERGLLQDEQIAVTNDRPTATAVTSSSDGGTLSTGELAAAVASGALLIAAAGFGATRRRMPPAQPA
jgi:hypothetical protein